jgi:hypothetical protein
MIRIINGDRPTRPTFQSGLCMIEPSDTMWNIITCRWDHIPDSRPTMPEVLDHLKAAHYNSSTEEFQLAIERRDLSKVQELDGKVFAGGFEISLSVVENMTSAQVSIVLCLCFEFADDLLVEFNVRAGS